MLTTHWDYDGDATSTAAADQDFLLQVAAEVANDYYDRRDPDHERFPVNVEILLNVYGAPFRAVRGGRTEDGMRHASEVFWCANGQLIKTITRDLRPHGCMPILF